MHPRLLQLVFAAGVFAQAAPAHASKVLVYGDRTTEANAIANTLTTQGHTVTVLSSLPADLSTYRTVWRIALNNLTSGEQTQLAAFIASGRGVYVTAENNNFPALNASVAAFVNSVVAGANTAFSTTVLPSNTQSFNPTAIGGITTTPNALTAYATAATGVFTSGVSGTHIVASTASNEVSAAAWVSADMTAKTGNLVVFADVNWPTFDPNASKITANIERFLETSCGDGFLASTETCDDGAVADGDGCSASCAAETGWSCAGAPSACTTICGDGIRAGTEGCDDDGLSAGDGCSATCTVEAGWVCAGMTPDVCEVDTDSDGLSDTDELAIDTAAGDADTDDDGVLDGAEPGFAADTDGDGLINARDPDSDNDGVFDGTELGIEIAGAATNLAAGHFIADADAGDTTTDPRDADSDNGGVRDGAEDANKNGLIDSGETDPNDGADDSSVVDTDGDGLSDAEETLLMTAANDADSDDDGVEDGSEANYIDDTDHDGKINALDPDSDGDGVLDGTEVGIAAAGGDTATGAGHFVADVDAGATTTSMIMADTDSGGVLDGYEDADHDGLIDASETDPNNPNDDVDGDRDGDGIRDSHDGLVDSDGDGTPNFRDLDSDGDTISDSQEAGDADLSTVPVDTDGDGTPDVRDLDSDGDGLTDAQEAGDTDVATPPLDTDTDGAPNFQDTDSDGDAAGDDTDNCLLVANPGQQDLDKDGTGDACSDDVDGDGIPDATDNCAMAVNADQADADGDGSGDACDMDQPEQPKTSSGGCATSGPSGGNVLLLIPVAFVIVRRRRRTVARG